MDHYFFNGGCYLFRKKNCLQAVVGRKKLSASSYELKKLSAKQKEIFWNTLRFQNFDTNWTRHRSIFQFHLIY